MRILAICWMVVALCSCAGGRVKETSPRHKLAQTYAEKGAAYLAEGNLEIAGQDLKKSLQLDPNNASAHGTLALLYERLGMLELAKAHHAKAAKLKPDDPGIVGNYGRFLCHHGHAQEGLRFLKKAAADKLYPKRWIPLTNAGECALTSGRHEEAEQYLRQAIDFNPSNAIALETMVKLMLAKGEYLRARAFLQRLEAISKPTPETLELGLKIESALGDTEAAAGYRKRLEERTDKAGLPSDEQ